MVQSIADWSALIGCGVGVLGLSTALNKGTIDSKDTLIRYLERQNEDLKESLQKEREQSSSALERLQKALENPSLEKIASEFPSQYAEILEILDSLSNLADEFEDCKRAAEWLEIKKNLWIEKATQEIWERHKGLLFPFFKKEKIQTRSGGVSRVDLCMSVSTWWQYFIKKASITIRSRADFFILQILCRGD
jgi:hypothetical protein